MEVNNASNTCDYINGYSHACHYRAYGLPSTSTTTGRHPDCQRVLGYYEAIRGNAGDDVVPVFIEGREYSAPAPEPYPKIHEGKAYLWKAGLYSAKEGKVWVAAYVSHRAVDGVAPEPVLNEKSYSADSLTVSDLADWNIDSPEACEIAAQNGAGEVTGIVLRTARLASIADNINGFYDPELIPESTKLFWLIGAGDVYYIDACTGEYLGSNTWEQINDIRKKQSTSPSDALNG